jgi:hypothetical protein
MWNRSRASDEKFGQARAFGSQKIVRGGSSVEGPPRDL